MEVVPRSPGTMQCLKGMLLSTDHGPTYIVVDDLDECLNTSGVLSAREQVLQPLMHLYLSFSNL